MIGIGYCWQVASFVLKKMDTKQNMKHTVLILIWGFLKERKVVNFSGCAVALLIWHDDWISIIIYMNL